MTYREKMHKALDEAINKYGEDADFHEDMINIYHQLAAKEGQPGRLALGPVTAMRALVSLEWLTR